MDDHIIVGNKAAGVLTVAAAWEREETVHHLLNLFVRKGNSKSKKCVFVVHRLDQATSGLLIFAKSEHVQQMIKDKWKDVSKTYYAVVHGNMPQRSGEMTSHLVEDDDYVVHSTSDMSQGRLSRTAYSVIKETNRFSLLKIDLLTGRKNQIRVHLADSGHPVVGDEKYGKSEIKYPRLALHSRLLSFTHPVTGQPLMFEAPVPDFFTTLMGKR